MFRNSGSPRENIFLEKFVESNSLSDAFDKFVNLGVLDLLASEECIDLPSTWFRKLVFMCIARAMEQAENHTQKVDFFDSWAMMSCIFITVWRGMCPMMI